MPQHNRPNAERLRMMMETNQVTADEVAEMLSVPAETVEHWLAPRDRPGNGEDISDEALTQLRMKLSVTR